MEFMEYWTRKHGTSHSILRTYIVYQVGLLEYRNCCYGSGKYSPSGYFGLCGPVVLDPTTIGDLENSGVQVQWLVL